MAASWLVHSQEMVKPRPMVREKIAEAIYITLAAILGIAGYAQIGVTVYAVYLWLFG